MTSRLTTTIGALTLPNPVICGSGEPVMTEAGIRAALAAGAAGVIAKSVNERPEAGRQLALADYIALDIGGGRSLFNRSGLTPRDTHEWFAAIAAIDREAAATGRFVAASIVLAGAEGAVSIAAMARAAGLRVFELNAGAPHASEASPGAIAQETDPARLRDLVAAVRRATEGMALWVKLTGLSSNLPALALAAKEGGADSVCMMGRFMAMIPDLDTFAPSSAHPPRTAEPGVTDRLPLPGAQPPRRRPGVPADGHQRRAQRGRRGAHGPVRRLGDRGVVDRHARRVRRHHPHHRGTGRVPGGARLPFAALIGQTADRLEGYGAQTPDPDRWRRFVPPETLE